MMMILLNIGYVYAFIPVVIIIILILAARGSIGRDFFQSFGIGQLTDMVFGIGGGGAGKGLQKMRYSATNTAGKTGKGPSSRVAGALFKTGRSTKEHKEELKNQHKWEYGGYKPGHGPGDEKPKMYRYSQWGRGDLWKARNNAKMELLKRMNNAELKALLVKHGVFYKANGLTEKSDIERVAANELGLRQIESHYNSTTALRAPPGAPAGLKPPSKVRLSIGDAYNYTFGKGGFYDRYEKIRSGKAMRDFAAGSAAGGKGSAPQIRNPEDENKGGAGSGMTVAQQGRQATQPGQKQMQEIKSVKEINDDNFHTVLGLPQKPPDFETARKAYIGLAKKLHPDVTDAKSREENKGKFKLVQAAYEAAKKHYGRK